MSSSAGSTSSPRLTHTPLPPGPWHPARHAHTHPSHWALAPCQTHTHTHTRLEIINEFRKIAGYKINTEKSVIFLYIDHEQSKKEIKKTIQFTIASKRIKYLGINQGGKDLYTENYKMMLKEMKDTHKWKDIPCSRIGRLHIIKMSTLLKVIYKFNAIFIKILMAFFTEMEKTILKLVWNPKRS